MLLLLLLRLCFMADCNHDYCILPPTVPEHVEQFTEATKTGSDTKRYRQSSGHVR